MNPYIVASNTPDKPAVILADTNDVLTYKELDWQARKIANFFKSCGLEPAGHIALMLPNGLDFHPVCWGAWYAGLYFTPISTHLRAEEAAYIIRDCGAELVVFAPEFEAVIREAREIAPVTEHWFTTGDAVGDFPSLHDAANGLEPLETSLETAIGADMLYSSGTTGRPKGILPALGKKRDEPDPLTTLLGKLYEFSGDAIYLNPAPLYHGSPLKFTMAIHRFGGTNVIMKKFDAEDSLAAIDTFSVSHSQWVPTMLHRMFRLPSDIKSKYNLSSHKVAIHAAAPCPPELKTAMIDWWGPIVHEFYAGSEAIGFTTIDSAEWLKRPGSVGRAVLGEVHITDEDGNEVPVGEVGLVYFGNGPKLAYYNDPEKTEAACLPNGWVTIGDMGRVDNEGYLYLADRKDFMIITGGVNVYPKEIEDVLVMHPAVQDIAVFGLPNSELGQEVTAIVQPTSWPVMDEPRLVESLTTYSSKKLSRIKTPRRFHFIEALPRQENGKLYKKGLRQLYLEEVTS